MSIVGEGPISGLCIVSDPEKCPPGYEIIYRSHDRKDDCDLWKDGFFRSRVTRYLCVTRVFPLDGGKLNNVLADICILNEREVPYSGFSLIDKTLDTMEPALKKKTISVKMVPRNGCAEAVCDLIILSKSKRAPIGYSLIGGDINGLTICYKLGSVPPETQNQQQTSSLPSSASFDASASMNSHHSNLLNNASSMAATPNPVTRQESIVGVTNPVHDVPFNLHPRFHDPSSLAQIQVPNTTCKSSEDIDNEFSYSFMVERSATSGS